jgi:hypothetical protein
VLHFVLIVIDRCLYLYRSVRGKIILQIFLLCCTYYFVSTTATTVLRLCIVWSTLTPFTMPRFDQQRDCPMVQKDSHQ